MSIGEPRRFPQVFLRAPGSKLEPRAAEQPAGLLREGDQVLGAEQADVELPIWFRIKRLPEGVCKLLS